MGVWSSKIAIVALGVVGIFTNGGNETTTPGNDVEVVIRSGFDVPAVPIIDVTSGFVSGVSFRGREILYEGTISSKVLPFFRHINFQTLKIFHVEK